METIVRCNIYRIRQEKNYTQEIWQMSCAYPNLNTAKKKMVLKNFLFEEIAQNLSNIKYRIKDLLTQNKQSKKPI